MVRSTWTVNTALREFDPETVMESVNEKTKSDVKAAFVLASESNPLSYYKDELERWQREKEELAQAQLAEIAAAPKKSKKGKTVSADEDEDDEDVDMADVGDEEVPAVKKTKKRKADEDTAVSHSHPLGPLLRLRPSPTNRDTGPSAFRLGKKAQD